MWYFRSLHGHFWRELESRLGEKAAVLDAGCGTGGLIRRLQPRRPLWRWAGVDLSPLALALARDRCPKSVELYEASVTALPLANDEFDAVVSGDVLYHVEDDAAALREFFRVLRPGGFAVLNLPAYRWLWSYHDVAVHSQRRYGRAELLAKLATAGFQPLRTTFWNTLPFPLIVARRKLFSAPSGGSDVRMMAPPVEAAFNAAMKFEHAWVRHVAGLPFGSSIFVVAQKPMSSIR